MGNPHKGEVSFESNGQVYIFKFGNGERATLERLENRTIAQLFKTLDNIGDAVLQSVFIAGLSRQHKLTKEQASDIIDDIGQDRAIEIMTEAVRLSQPEVAATGNPNPTMTTPKANGIGTSSNG